MTVQAPPASVTVSKAPFERQQLEDIGFMTCMTLTLLGNYAQTGHFGGPTAYTPFNVATHLAGPEAGGLRYDYRRPKHPYSDKFMLAAGHCAPTCYALWIIMGEALNRKFQKTGDRRYYVAPDIAMLPVDALGFRRGAGALKTLLADHGLTDHNAGIDDSLIGGVINRKFDGYKLIEQWMSYGWNVFSIPDGHDYNQIVNVLHRMEKWDPNDRRPMIVFGKTTKGYWPAAVNG